MQVGGDALDAENLLNVGKVHEIVEFGAGPKPPDLNAAMPFIDGLDLRGEKPPCGVVRCRRARWAGFL